MIIACWSGPRNISTALMRSWSSRQDTYTIDEPFYAYYLKKSKLRHPMYEEIIKHYPTDYNSIVKNLTENTSKKNTIFYQKHMAHHLTELNNINWVRRCENCILIRHPKEVISSYTKKNQLNNIYELGYIQQYKIVKFLLDIDKSFIVIDSFDLLNNPKKILSEWCNKINLDFSDSMLSWEKGSHESDGIWWKHWYDNVIETTGFQRYQKKDINIENKYDSIYNESMEYYNYLKGLK